MYAVNRQTSLPLSMSAVKPIVQEVILFEGQRCDEVSVLFVEADEISDLHAKFFNDPSPTDCISFPMDMEDNIDTTAGYRVLGEIIVCPAVALEYSIKHALDPYQEATLYLVHGLLHLMGYDDIEEVDEAAMRFEEKRHMKHLHDLGLCLHA